MCKLSSYEYYRNDNGILYCGDVFDILPKLKRQYVGFIDPPYNINFPYKWFNDNFDDYIEFSIRLNELLQKKCELYFITPGNNNYTIYDKDIDKFSGITYWICRNKRTRGTAHHFAKTERIYIYGELSEKLPMDFIETNYKKISLPENMITKPVELYVQMLKKQYKELPLLDCFFHSGTMAIAAGKLGRKWIGIEISQEYCEIAKKRIEQENAQIKMEL